MRDKLSDVQPRSRVELASHVFRKVFLLREYQWGTSPPSVYPSSFPSSMGWGQGDAGAAAGGSQGPRPSNKRLQQTQAQVDEVVGIMKVCLFEKHFLYL
ncbi:hypothetical protein KIN20_003449 [Parelaphostrongylus tenuis]|uniref:Uncharacterized protein n=1 Tax=Parelaphostrongylus tenuis TaxID=148309 RepID=A0AAD5LZ64_PARTN|nr:hypothetical protein KIN20_003449 [Parelaphostrongylus tenuis]